MALTARAPLLALAGALLVFAAPLRGWMVGYVAAALVLVAIVDLVLAASPRDVALSRDGAVSTRLGEPAAVVLSLHNRGPRPLRGGVRDGWPPSADAAPRVHRVDVQPDGVQRVVTTLRPQRRGERAAGAVTIRAVGPLGVAARQRTRRVPWTV